MTASLLIGLIGLTDILRTEHSRRAGWILTIALWLPFAVFAGYGLAMHPIAIVAVLLVTAGWVLAMPSTDGATPRRLWPAFALVPTIVLVAPLGDRWTTSPGPLSEALARAGGALDSLPLESIVAVIGVGAFLVASGNLITRAALRRATDTDREADPDARGRWRLTIRGVPIGELHEQRADPGSMTELRGGRLIGPIERILIVILALVGGFVLIAALVAAKGVVRFPEISADRGVGSKAEEFLVGSLASWTIATAATLYLASVFYL